MIRTHRLHALALAMAAFVAAGCGGTRDATTDTTSAAGDTTPAATPAAAPDLERQVADVASYRLTMEGIDKYLQAQRNIVQKAQSMTEAEKQAASATARNDESAQDVDGLARQVESTPPMRDAVRAAGLSPREYAVLTYAMMSSAMAAGIQKMRPNDDADSLARAMKASPENARFYREHEAEITRKMQEMQAAMKGGQ